MSVERGLDADWGIEWIHKHETEKGKQKAI
jgi:hypothetical protein